MDTESNDWKNLLNPEDKESLREQAHAMLDGIFFTFSGGRGTDVPGLEGTGYEGSYDRVAAFSSNGKRLSWRGANPRANQHH